MESITGLPSRSPNVAIHYIPGTLPMRSLIIMGHLSFLYRILSLPDSASNCSSNRIHSILEEMVLPSVSELTLSLPSKKAWNAHIRATLLLSVGEQLQREAATKPSLSNARLLHSKFNGKPLSIFKGDIGLSRLNNFRLRLILQCSILNKDTSSFHSLPGRVRDPTCPLCHASLEDVAHFVTVCPYLKSVQDRWLPHLQIDPDSLLNHVMGNPWLHDLQFQQDIVEFLADLRTTRALFSN